MSVAVYAGTFDPVTNGHASVVLQAARLFAHVRVLIAVNSAKRTLFDEAERIEMIVLTLGKIPNVSVDSHRGYVVDYARSIGASVLVRGIRGASDATFETDLAQQNRALAPEIATVLLPAEPLLSAVSSSDLKTRAERGEDLLGICSPIVAERLVRKLRSKP